MPYLHSNYSSEPGHVRACIKCNVTKPEAEFYPYRGFCKACLYAKCVAYNAAHPENNRAYKRVYNRLHSEEKKKRTYAYLAADPRRLKARNDLHYALHAGRLKKLPCEHCGKEPVHGHHPNYDEPKVVVWLCASCHKKEHKRMKEAGIEP